MNGRMGAADAEEAERYNVMDTTFVLGPDFPLFKKMNQIHKPEPTQAVVFADESIETIDDGFFAMQMNPVWQNSPTVRHARGGTFSFADGHAERWRWSALNREQGGFEDPVSGGVDTTVDLIRVQNAVAEQ